MMMINRSILEQFIGEVLSKWENQDIKLLDSWFPLSEFDCLRNLAPYELSDVLRSLNFVNSIKDDYVNVDKIEFILFGLRFLPADLKDLSHLLDFKGFEVLIKELLLKNGFHAINNFRFTDNSPYKSKTKQKRYEIDVIGINRNHVLVIDAKKWNKKDSFSAMCKAADLQHQRVLALKKNPDAVFSMLSHLLGTRKLQKRYLPLYLIPIMVTYEENKKYQNLNRIPLVPISRFNSFLQEFQDHLEYLPTVKIGKIQVQTRLF